MYPNQGITRHMQKRPKKKEIVDKRLSRHRPILEYWENSLKLQSQFQVENEFKNLPRVEISIQSMEKGSLSDSELEKFLKLISSNQGSKYTPDDEDSHNIIICPVRISKSESRDGNIFEILKIPAILNSNGKLSPPTSLLPWIPRIYLEPTIEDNLPSISDVEEVEAFFEKQPRDKTQSFSKYIKYCETFFTSVTGFNFNDFLAEDYLKISGASIHHVEDQASGTEALIKLFEVVLKGKRDLGAMPILCLPAKSKSNYKFNKKFIYLGSRNHVGHFNANFPLSTSQRSSLYKLSYNSNLNLLPIDGPPGTGKTTVIQSIIANALVKSVLDASKSPPIIVVCGATNQSVTNVIDCLDNSKEVHPISERWIPGLKSYGLFCVSRSKSESAQGYNLEQSDGSGFFLDLAKQTDLSYIEKFFLEKFNSNLESTKSLKQALNILKKRILDLNVRLKTEIKNTLPYSFFSRSLGLLSGLSQTQYESEIEKLSPLDTKFRYLSFVLATHYWEAKWISEAKNFYNSILNKDNLKHSKTEIWKWKAMLTPTFVSTVYMAPKFFQDRIENKPIIDVLIIDEAGQVLPEEGAIVASLAKSIIPIGDTKQLKPYSLIPASLDKIQLDESKISKKLGLSYDSLVESGYTSAKGSLMQLAKTCCPIKDDYGPGASLNEHRRSVPKIVKFCNELSYNGRLIPKRPQPNSALFPPFLGIQVDGNSSKIGSSRTNVSEARAINEWLQINQAAIVEFYETNCLEEALAVLTPFTAQVAILKKHLKGFGKNLIVGTVNSLQGAERSIILFSPVYDNYENTRFMLDRDTTLLNVAVSRAKDSFIVLGNLEMLRKGGNAPSGLLSKFLSS